MAHVLVVSARKWEGKGQNPRPGAQITFLTGRKPKDANTKGVVFAELVEARMEPDLFAVVPDRLPAVMEVSTIGRTYEDRQTGRVDHYNEVTGLETVDFSKQAPSVAQTVAPLHTAHNGAAQPVTAGVK